MSKRLIVVLFIVLLFVSVTGVSAQEVDVLPERVDHEVASTLIINQIVGLVIAAFGAAPITVLLVSFLKPIKQLQHIPAQHITFAVAAVLYVLALGASVIGRTVEFEGLLETLVVVAPVLVSFVGTLIAAPAQYHVAKALNVPVIGESREHDVKWS